MGQGHDRAGEQAERGEDLPQPVVQLAGEVGPLVGLGVWQSPQRPTVAMR